MQFLCQPLRSHQKHANNVDNRQNQNSFKLSPVWVGNYCTDKWCEITNGNIGMIYLGWHVLLVHGFDINYLPWKFNAKQRLRHSKRAFSKANKLIQVKNQNSTHTIISISFAKLIANYKNYPPRVVATTPVLCFFIFFFDLIRCVEGRLGRIFK